VSPSTGSSLSPIGPVSKLTVNRLPFDDGCALAGEGIDFVADERFTATLTFRVEDFGGGEFAESTVPNLRREVGYKRPARVRARRSKCRRQRGVSRHETTSAN
jgi:hypothetical protein